MADGADEGRRRGDDPRSLRHVRAAQLRVRAARWAITRLLLGTVFLLGALSYAFGPEPHAESSTTWMALLVVLSTAHVGLGLRALGRVRRRPLGRLWLPLTLSWGVLSTVLLKVLLTR